MFDDYTLLAPASTRLFMTVNVLGRVSKNVTWLDIIYFRKNMANEKLPKKQRKNVGLIMMYLLTIWHFKY